MSGWSAAACTPGPGSPPSYSDAAVRFDGGLKDADPAAADALPRDAGEIDAEISLRDSGRPAEYPFSGVFGILNSDDPLYAREVGGRLNLVVGVFPYIYVGTISPTGAVDVTSHVLVRSGCAVARIRGTYDRASSAYALVHETCNSRLMPIESPITGAFAADFHAARSGTYELTATVVQDLRGCFTGTSSIHVVRYAFSFLGSGDVAVFTADDLIEPPAWYEGLADEEWAFAAISQYEGSRTTRDVSLSGWFTQATENEPLRFTGLRDVYDSNRDCVFSVTLDGTRLSSP